jgi:hypothetical protein
MFYLLILVQYLGKAKQRLIMSKRTEKTCFLYGNVSTMNMTQFSNWNEEIKLFVTKHKEVPPTATVCKKDLLEAQRHYNDDTYLPKWMRTTTSPSTITK